MRFWYVTSALQLIIIFLLIFALELSKDKTEEALNLARESVEQTKQCIQTVNKFQSIAEEAVSIANRQQRYIFFGR